MSTIIQSTQETFPLLATSASKAPSPCKNDVQRGLLMMAISALCHSLMCFCAHLAEIQYGVPVATLMLIRGMTSVSMCTTTLLLRGELRSALGSVPLDKFVPLVVRGLSGATSSLCFFQALGRVPAGVATTVFNVAPTLTCVLAWVVFRDPFTRLHGVVLVANLAGVVLVSRPSAGTSLGGPTVQVTHGVGFALASAVCATGVALSIKKLGGRVHAVVMTLAFGSSCLLLVALAGGWRVAVDGIVHGNPRGVAMAVGGSFCGFGTQTLMAIGMRTLPAGPAVVLRTLNVPTVFLLAGIFMGETVGALNVVGVLLVLGSVVPVGVMSMRAESAVAGDVGKEYESGPDDCEKREEAGYGATGNKGMMEDIEAGHRASYGVSLVRHTRQVSQVRYIRAIGDREVNSGL